MGISPFNISSSTYDYDDNKVSINPDPYDFEIVSEAHSGNYKILTVEYKGCTNYEGKKILLIKGPLPNNDSLDPHFSENFPGLLARFQPTDFGKTMAYMLLAELTSKIEYL